MSISLVIDLEGHGACYSSHHLSLVDPLQDDLLGETDEVGSQKEHIHIRIQQRNGRKTLTTLQGLGKGSYRRSLNFRLTHSPFLSII